MKLKLKGKLSKHFSEIKDPLIGSTKRYKLIDIPMIAILAVICETDIWVGMESFGQVKHCGCDASWNYRTAFPRITLCPCICSVEPKAASRVLSKLGTVFGGLKL